MCMYQRMHCLPACPKRASAHRCPHGAAAAPACKERTICRREAPLEYVYSALCSRGYTAFLAFRVSIYYKNLQHAQSHCKVQLAATWQCTMVHNTNNNAANVNKPILKSLLIVQYRLHTTGFGCSGTPLLRLDTAITLPRVVLRLASASDVVFLFGIPCSTSALCTELGAWYVLRLLSCLGKPACTSCAISIAVISRCKSTNLQLNWPNWTESEGQRQCC
jgi:hypothetical protein